jgi:hypothetical protein
MPLRGKKERITLDAIICMGQSNEAGGGSSSVGVAYRNSQPNTYIYFKPDDTSSNNGTLQQYQWGVNSMYNSNFLASNDCSVGIEFNRLTGKPLLIIKYAVSGSALVDDGSTTTAVGLWQIDANNSRANNRLLYNMALNNFIIPCINYCTRNEITLNIIASCWTQGEADSNTLIRANNYQTELIRLFDALKTALLPYGVLSENYKPLITRIHNNFTVGTRPYLSTVRTALENVANYYGGQWINSDSYAVVADNTHWSDLGQEQHGIDRANKLVDYYL